MQLTAEDIKDIKASGDDYVYCETESGVTLYETFKRCDYFSYAAMKDNTKTDVKLIKIDSI